ncbi:MAG: hypothetical protein ACOCTG_02225, partial [Bacteroidota bacterium]
LLPDVAEAAPGVAAVGDVIIAEYRTHGSCSSELRLRTDAQRSCSVLIGEGTGNGFRMLP